MRPARCAGAVLINPPVNVVCPPAGAACRLNVGFFPANKCAATRQWLWGNVTLRATGTPLPGFVNCARA